MFIKTERLVLKPFEKRDDAVLAALFRDEQIKKTYMLPDFDEEAQAIKLAERFRVLSLDQSRFVAGIYLDEKLIGFVNDVGIDGCTVELGYVVAPIHHNRGYATEALQGAIGYLMAHGMEKVAAGAFEENRASIRVMEKAGMRKLDAAEEIQYRGKTHRCVFFAAEKNREK